MAHEFKVDDMTCDHCVSSITKSLRTFDPKATVAIDLASRTVAIDGVADRADYAFVIRDAGYTPQ